MILNQHLLYQIIDVWYHIRKLYLINNEKNDKIKLNHFFYKRRPITSWTVSMSLRTLAQITLICFFMQNLHLKKKTSRWIENH